MIEKTCGRCGRTFMADESGRRYCSIQCSNRGRPQPPGTPWTQERLQTVAARYAREPAAAIAADMGMTKGQVIGAMNRHGIGKKPDRPRKEARDVFPPRERCVWPYGDPRAADFRFCGAEALPGRPYCAGHWRIAYN